jgi:ABC-2 type transport system ATP-binding protein
MIVPAVITTGLSKRFGSGAWALRELDLTVEPGEVVGYLGPNGAGKTTTLRLLLGLLRPTSGSAAIFGVDASRNPVEAHRRVAYVPGEASLWPRLTGAQTLDYLAGLHGGCDEHYRAELMDTFALDPDVRVREYSKGNRQKLSLIAALATRADLLLLDEPTSGLDPLMEQRFRDEVRTARARGQAVLLSSHILAEVEALSDRIAILRGGRLVDLGTLEQMRHLAMVDVDVAFAGEPPDLSRVPGVVNPVRTGHAVHCQVAGPIDALVKALASHDVIALSCREPSLEQLFLSHYGSSSEPGRDTTAPQSTAARPC